MDPADDSSVPLEERGDQWLYDRVAELAEHLRAGDLGYQWHEPETMPSGVIATAWTDYAGWLWHGIWCGITLLRERLHVDWESHYLNGSTSDKTTIPAADLDRLGAWFMTYGSGERFCDGLIAGGVDDGTVLAMAERLLELVPSPTTNQPPAGDDVAGWRLRFGDLLTAAGIDPADVLAIRHTYQPGGLGSPAAATPQAVLDYTRVQEVRPSKVPATPPRWWFIFMAEGGRCCRLATVYENRGLLTSDVEENRRVFDLAPASLVANLQGRLVIEWSKDAVNWAKTGTTAAGFDVVEVADRAAVPFPGYDKVLVDYATLQRVVSGPQYQPWRVALAAVKGIYLIADTHDGKLYVGKADGANGILGRWTAYASDGHGGNIGMLTLAQLDPAHPHRYQFSLLQVFGPATPSPEVDRAEEHYKQALLSRTFGLNQN